MAGRPFTLASVTVARSDYNIYLPVYREIMAEPSLRLEVIAAAAHLDARYGRTVELLERDAMPIADRVEMTQPGDAPLDIATAMARGVECFARSYVRLQPDLLLVLGDRYEMLAAVAAALPFNLPVAHIHGGESSEGAMDELARHAITKMSHVHFVSTETHARRVIQMGEAPDRVFVSGAPALDLIRTLPPLTRDELGGRLGWKLPERYLLVAYHPVTLEHQDTARQVGELLDAVSASGLPSVILYPNADTSSHTIIAMIEKFAAASADHRVVQNLPAQTYYPTMSHAVAMVGNSSSGIIEAASFGLPVVNVGPRQQGRLRPRNVIDVPCERGAVAAGITQATSSSFRQSLVGLANPYGDGHAAERIVTEIKRLPPRAELLVKRFHDSAGIPPA